MESQKCLKQGKCTLCSIPGGSQVPKQLKIEDGISKSAYNRGDAQYVQCSKKVLKTVEMLNMFTVFNFEGKCGKGIEHGTFPLGIERIEHIEHFPCFKNFLEHAPPKLNILSISTVLSTF